MHDNKTIKFKKLITKTVFGHTYKHTLYTHTHTEFDKAGQPWTRLSHCGPAVAK